MALRVASYEFSSIEIILTVGDESAGTDVDVWVGHRAYHEAFTSRATNSLATNPAANE